MKQRNRFAFALLVCIMIFSLTVPTLAVNTHEKHAWENLVGKAAQEYYSESGFEAEAPTLEIKELFLSTDTLHFPAVSFVEYVDALVLLDDGSYFNVSEWAEWHSEDDSIVSADRGRIDAVGTGSTTVVVTYQGYSINLNVQVSEGTITSNTSEEVAETFTLEKGQMLTRANNCLNYTWTPTQNLTKWRGNGVYYANTTYSGLPYSQTPKQAYPVTYSPYATRSFTSAMSNSDFYTSYTSDTNIVMPMYGLDCSGFLSYCFGTTRKNTTNFLTGIYNGTYSAVGGYTPSDFINSDGTTKTITNSMKEELIVAYDSLLYCEGLVKSGHCMFATSIDRTAKTVSVVEQTPSGTITSTYTYNTLASSGYLPFK